MMAQNSSSVGKLWLSPLFAFCIAHLVSGDITWPEYSQQCRDDAGPPYEDDQDNFGDGKYHDGSVAYPILPNGECAPKMQYACSIRPNYKTAYLEGPVDCGDKGWYCRMFRDPEWNSYNLRSDYNFGHCNTTEGFAPWGYDGDGHCHGSSSDNTYYWWIRDHWFRRYNGRVRCCCGWYDAEDLDATPITEGRIANRCDYRRLLTSDENPRQCRDANEGHGLNYEDGCDGNLYGDQIGSPIPENDDQCWEIAKFGDAPPSPSTPTPSRPITPTTASPIPPTPPTPPTAPTPASPAPSAGNAPPTTGGCANTPFQVLVDKEPRFCQWVGSNPSPACEYPEVSSTCPESCNTCELYGCSDSGGTFVLNGDPRDCATLRVLDAGIRAIACAAPGIAETCRSTCDFC